MFTPYRRTGGFSVNVQPALRHYTGKTIILCAVFQVLNSIKAEFHTIVRQGLQQAAVLMLQLPHSQ
jgi:hypothetical protein